MSLYHKLVLLALLACGAQTLPLAEEAASHAASTKSAADKYITPENLEKCTNDENLNECLKRLMGVMWQRLKDGNAELGLKPVDPFHLNRITFQYTNGPISSRITAKNVKITGFADHIFKSVDVKLTKDKISMRNVGFVPKMFLTGNYKADMSINSVHVKPKGEFNVTLLDVEITTIAEGDIYSKDDHRFVRLTKMETDPKIGDLKIKANGIFPDPTLDEIVLSVTNDHWREVYSNILPETRKFWQPLVLQLSNEGLKYMPIDEFIEELK